MESNVKGSWKPTLIDLFSSSGKLEFLDRLLPKLIMLKKKVVIFSQFKELGIYWLEGVTL